MAKRGRKSSTPAHSVEAVVGEAAGTGTASAVSQAIHAAVGEAAGTGKAEGRGLDAMNEGAALGAMAYRKIQNRKAEQDAFERDVAFEYFSRIPRERLANPTGAGHHLDRIAEIIEADPRGRDSFKEIRRRLGSLRKEFLGRHRGGRGG